MSSCADCVVNEKDGARDEKWGIETAAEGGFNFKIPELKFSFLRSN